MALCTNQISNFVRKNVQEWYSERYSVLLFLQMFFVELYPCMTKSVYHTNSFMKFSERVFWDKSEVTQYLLWTAAKNTKFWSPKVDASWHLSRNWMLDLFRHSFHPKASQWLALPTIQSIHPSWAYSLPFQTVRREWPDHVEAHCYVVISDE